MPSYNDIELPTVTVNGNPEEIAAKLADQKMPVEAMIELAVYAKREREKAAAFEEIEKVMRGRINEAYEKRNPEDRETTRTEVALLTYSEGGEKIELKDRDWTVEHLTDEQLRISYKPDLKNLETILKPDEFERHVKRTPKPPATTLRDTKKDDFHEIDF